MIKIMLKRRKERDTYLAADRRYRQSTQIVMKVDKVCSFQPSVRPSSAEEEEEFSSSWRGLKRKRSLPLQLMKSAVLTESYTLYPLSSISADSDDVYCQ